jgi:hypothetical protein
MSSFVHASRLTLLLALVACSPQHSHLLPDGGDACSGDPSFVETNCRCDSAADCRGARTGGGTCAKWACTPANVCLAICCSNEDCPTGNVCEDLICRPGGLCDGPGSCPAGKQCVAGSCTTPIAVVARCSVVPSSAVMNAGTSRTFSIVGYDRDGAAIPYAGSVTWSPAGLDATTSATGISATFSLPSSAAAKSGTIGATIGPATCTSAAVVQFAAPPPGALRVVVISKGVTTTGGDSTPLAGAVVVVDGTTRVTGNDGVATFDGFGGAMHDVSVFAADHSYATVLQTSASDLLIPLRATPMPAHFAGQWTPNRFDNLSNPNGALHVSVSGASVAGSLIDVSVSGLLGQTQSVAIDFGTGPLGPYSIPEGVALGLGEKMFGDGTGGHFGIQATPGLRALWTFGGNAIVGDVLLAIGPLLTGGDASQQVAALLTAFLPIIGSLESGITSGLSVDPGATGTVSIGGTGVSVRPDTLMRLREDVLTPPLPTYTNNAGDPAALDALVIVGGAQLPEQGFVPVGLTAGFDRKDEAGEAMPDQITDAVGNAAPQHLPLRFAPRHGGVENGPLSFLTLALSTPTLASLFGSVDPTEPLVLAGRVSRFVKGTTTPYAPTYNNGLASPMDLSQSFLAVPGAATIDDAGRQIALSTAEGATFVRIDVGPADQLWSVYAPTGTTRVVFPAVPAAFDDHFTGANAANPTGVQPPPMVMLHAVSLGYAPSGRTTPLSYDDLWRFDGADADDLTETMDAFSSREVTRPAAQR